MSMKYDPYASERYDHIYLGIIFLNNIEQHGDTFFRWWPQGRAVGYGIDHGFQIVINEYEHLRLEWTIHQGAYVSCFHKFFKALNNFHKYLKRKQLGGFWKDPKYGYISG